MNMKEFNKLVIIRGFGKKHKNIRTTIVRKFGIRKPVLWEQVKNYLIHKERYKEKHIVVTMKQYISKHEDFDFQMRVDKDNRIWIVFLDKRINERYFDSVD